MREDVPQLQVCFLIGVIEKDLAFGSYRFVRDRLINFF